MVLGHLGQPPMAGLASFGQFSQFDPSFDHLGLGRVGRERLEGSGAGAFQGKVNIEIVTKCQGG